MTREAFRHYSAAKSAEEAAEKAATLTLRGARIECPLYVIQGELDPLIPQEQGERVAAIAGGEVVYHLVPGGGHGVNNLRYQAVPLANDWLARHLQT
ncbi:MAG TPA: hypothetical protein VLA54_09395 [Acidimicrobiia bacterium]|nr:hypothetical protein [Acidimicrobiia bacterium]